MAAPRTLQDDIVDDLVACSPSPPWATIGALSVGEDPGDVGAQGGGFGGSLVQGVGGEAGSFVFVVRLEPAAGVGEQFALEVRGDQLNIADPPSVSACAMSSQLRSMHGKRRRMVGRRVGPDSLAE
jgi:hypothetical protein